MTKNLQEKFPWQLAMQFGFGVLHLTPKDFWSMTLVEFNAALQLYFGKNMHPIERNNLEELLKNFPDK